VEVVEEVAVVEEEVVVEEVVVECHPWDHLRPQDKMFLHPKGKSKLWDNSHASSQGTEARPTTLSTNFVATFG
jgi:hypothetical protein